MAKQAHDQGFIKSRRRGAVRVDTDYNYLARLLVERGLCTAYILQGRSK